MPLSHGWVRMTSKQNDNTAIESIKARDFERYMAAVEEYIESRRRPIDDKD